MWEHRRLTTLWDLPLREACLLYENIAYWESYEQLPNACCMSCNGNWNKTHIAVFSVMRPCGFVGVCQGFGRCTASICELLLYSKNGGSILLRNVGNHLPVSVVSTQKTTVWTFIPVKTTYIIWAKVVWYLYCYYYYYCYCCCCCRR
jgi:hypothetical protein